MQGAQVDGIIRIGKLKVKQISDTCKIVAPRSGWYEFGVFYFFVLLTLLVSKTGSFQELWLRFTHLLPVYSVPAAIGLLRATVRHVITIDQSRVWVDRIALGFRWQTDIYPWEPGATLRFVPSGRGRRHSNPNVLALSWQGRERYFAPFITLSEASDLLSILRMQLPKWFQQ